MFYDKMAYAREAFTNTSTATADSQYSRKGKGKKPKRGIQEEHINFTGLNKVLYEKEYLRLTIMTPRGNADDEPRYKRHYTNDLPDDRPDVDKDGNMIIWYGVEELYRELGGFAQD